jgi:FimV-like protein
MRNVSKSLFTLILFVFSISIHAIQLGKISVNSKQEQPLNADIEIIITKADDVTQLVPSIASKADFESQGIERLPVHGNIDANFVKNSEGKVYLKLKSGNPVKDPFLDLLIQIDSPEGRNYREYTVLLDPPDPMDKMINETLEKEKSGKDNKSPSERIEEGKSIEVEDKKDTSIEEISNVNEKEAETVAKDINSEKESVTEEKKQNNKNEKLNEEPLEEEIVTVKSLPGKTLYQIGRENLISGITLEQMVVAIFLNNKNAFAQANINGLNKNQVLEIPPKEFFSDLSHIEARKILKRENNNWKEINGKQDKAQKKIDSSTKDSSAELSLEQLKKIKDLELKLAETEQRLNQYQTENNKTSVDKEVVEKKPDTSLSIKGDESEELMDGFEIEEIILDDDLENNDDVFTSSISTDSEIEENIILDESSDKKDNLLIVLVLLFVIVVIAGIIFFISMKRKSDKLFEADSLSNIPDNDIIDELSGDNKNNY